MFLLQCWAWECIKSLSPSCSPLKVEERNTGHDFPLLKHKTFDAKYLQTKTISIITSSNLMKTCIVYIKWLRVLTHFTTSTMALI